jgi:DNA-binding MarR family transcriptional regulator
MSTATVDFGVLLNIGFGVFKTALHAHLAHKGFEDIGSSFGYVFRLLDRAPGKLSTVAIALGITPQGALKVVNDMVAKGYVERHEDAADGRSKLLSLTPRARAAMSVAAKFHRRFEADLAARIGAEAAHAARLALEDIVAHYPNDGRLRAG